jgi:hypothetical protein
MQYLRTVVWLMLLTLTGCNSIAQKQARFRDSCNREIGEPFYVHDAENRDERVISANLSEFVPRSLKPGQCVVVWTVDTTERGKYRHPNGTTFDIMGYKKSWRYSGNSQNCMIELGGPW